MTTTRSEQDQHIAAWQASGMSQAAYCRSVGIPHYRLAYWLKQRRRREEAAEVAEEGFVEIGPPASPEPAAAENPGADASSSTAAIIIFLPPSVEIHIPAASAPETIRAIVHQVVSGC